MTSYGYVTKPGRRLRYPGPLALFVVFTLTGVLSFAHHYFGEAQTGRSVRVWPDLLLWLTCAYPWILFSPLIFKLEARFQLGHQHRFRNLAVFALTGLTLSYVAYKLTVFSSALMIAAMNIRTVPSQSVFVWGMPIGEVLTEQSFYWTVLAAGYLLRTSMQLQDQERETSRLALEKSQLESSLREAELQALRMRLNPHFLFNTLQNASTLVQYDPKTASRMLTRLGDVLRIALGREVQSEVILRDEIALTRDYLDIERMRFGDKLSLQIDVAPETEGAFVPSLLLQPIVENAIKHGLRGTPNGGKIAVRSRREGDRLALTVRDNGIGLVNEPEALELGIGLGATQQRLERMYPGRFEFTLHRPVDGGTEIRISFPFQSKEPKQACHDEQPAIANC